MQYQYAKKLKIFLHKNAHLNRKKPIKIHKFKKKECKIHKNYVLHIMHKRCIIVTSYERTFRFQEERKMIKAGIIGATGYAGNELARLLLGHKEVEVAWYGSRSYIDQKYADVYQNFFKLVDAKCMDDNMAS